MMPINVLKLASYTVAQKNPFSKVYIKTFSNFGKLKTVLYMCIDILTKHI